MFLLGSSILHSSLLSYRPASPTASLYCSLNSSAHWAQVSAFSHGTLRDCCCGESLSRPRHLRSCKVALVSTQSYELKLHKNDR